MLSQPFRTPIRVWVGLGFPRQLNTVADAYQFVVDWCGNSPEQRAAIRACKAALVGDVDAEIRGVLVAFARKKDILLEDGAMPPLSGKAPQTHVCLTRKNARWPISRRQKIALSQHDAKGNAKLEAQLGKGTCGLRSKAEAV
ncbi:DUF982 domain-containing protein [Mesorhizobium sp.]|uniref:DUF982 domain-containing protein n=1 Tax=Mesorhizobium sp. TaxID=1871066 RepID=UPI000FE33628|nr:DUF982 domain-containing protein [Mesorhizobium sp.]RWJ96521.1 MAG: DUF982 domain-containing protein [Mesorhizobium sp.]